ncbi:MAG: hypothetical protein A3E78_12955 [Alphaproteobacteria bacterium RIFCSPHIGHO2_12_FULL_63_12]|nr:MAG: hypothetical protein A3E78_12955 [Alphaproteobacteria bacterium RIFCSPHIGHO2_12_FULL_63_12]
MTDDAPRDCHHDSPTAVVFDDFHSPGHRRTRLIGALVLLAASVILPRVGVAGFNPRGLPVDLGLLAGGAALLIWEAHAYFISGAAPGRNGFVIIDEAGIGGDALKRREARIEWARLISIRPDQHAVIVNFRARDPSSSNPLDRISEIRLAAPNASPDQIIEAIRRFWTPPERE